ncbi:hypothetical protein FRC17_004413 [Serendipita sp. 399]|nr:hypothetical protein FRC17_004413 [Serendipita sp. 399]
MRADKLAQLWGHRTHRLIIPEQIKTGSGDTIGTEHRAGKTAHGGGVNDLEMIQLERPKL